LPVGLFLVVAAILFFLYTRPHVAPGHRDLVPAGPGGPRAAVRTGGAHAAAAGTGGASESARTGGAQPPAAPEADNGTAPKAEDG
ncbi:MAG: hypothetical protein J2P34_02575, partial [Actinobacteria bacterium]|nr:hypothetical protein [Actinomycetota bacterium]